MSDFFNFLLEIFYIIIGIQFAYSAYSTFCDKTNPHRIGSAIFWLDLACLFALGKWLPSILSGFLVLILGVVTLFKRFGVGTRFTTNKTTSSHETKHLGWKIFIPVITMALVALVIATLFNDASVSAVGIGAFFALLFAIILFQPKFSAIIYESDRNVQQVGTTSILPQLLAALGVIFTQANVGTVVANSISHVIPEGNVLIGIIIYVLAMVLFTMVMGNAFAAFTVITTGIGVPFVLAFGANPILVGALGMTAGFCGTLITPMAGNFNALPAALMEMESDFDVIKRQIPIALALILTHIVLLCFLAL